MIQRGKMETYRLFSIILLIIITYRFYFTEPHRKEKNLDKAIRYTTYFTLYPTKTGNQF